MFLKVSKSVSKSFLFNKIMSLTQAISEGNSLVNKQLVFFPVRSVCSVNVQTLAYMYKIKLVETTIKKKGKDPVYFCFGHLKVKNP